jgi:hypothetical protein
VVVEVERSEKRVGEARGSIEHEHEHEHEDEYDAR